MRIIVFEKVQNKFMRNKDGCLFILNDLVYLLLNDRVYLYQGLFSSK
jgi:hypothetical protein